MFLCREEFLSRDVTAATGPCIVCMIVTQGKKKQCVWRGEGRGEGGGEGLQLHNPVLDVFASYNKLLKVFV